jgi:hypothetical protein
MVCNFRKTRKRGGVDVSTVLNCEGAFRTKEKCLDEFLRQQQFYKIDIPPDGNCFYNTIVKYLELTNNTQYPKDHLRIRKMVVDALEDNIQEVSAYLPINNSNINQSSNNYNSLVLVKQLEALDRLRQDSVWNSDTADLVIQYASRALNMTINIYDFKAATRARKGQPAQPAQFIRYIIRPFGISRITINMLRVDNNHFNLLLPVANVAPAVSAIIAALSSAAPAPASVAPAPVPASTKPRPRPRVAPPAPAPAPAPIGNIDFAGPLPEKILNNVINIMSRQPNTTKKKNAPKPRPRPRVAPSIANNMSRIKLSNEEEAIQRQVEEFKKYEQIASNAAYALSLQGKNNEDPKPPQKNKTKRKPRK